jgi:hypothetical protein
LKASVDIPLSPRNLRRMRAFYRTHRPTPKPNAIWSPSVAKLESPNWPAVAESLPWSWGKGFAFIGSQVHLRVHDSDYYLDLLFWHVKLHCFVVIELKEGHFKPEHAGKMNFNLSAVDDLREASRATLSRWNRRACSWRPDRFREN